MDIHIELRENGELVDAGTLSILWKTPVKEALVIICEAIQMPLDTHDYHISIHRDSSSDVGATLFSYSAPFMEDLNCLSLTDLKEPLGIIFGANGTVCQGKLLLNKKPRLYPYVPRKEENLLLRTLEEIEFDRKIRAIFK